MGPHLLVAHQTASSPELHSRVLRLLGDDPAAEFVLLVPATPIGPRPAVRSRCQFLRALQVDQPVFAELLDASHAPDLVPRYPGYAPGRRLEDHAGGPRKRHVAIERALSSRCSDRASTMAPTAMSSTSVHSCGEWLMPSRLGTNSMPVGATTLT